MLVSLLCAYIGGVGIISYLLCAWFLSGLALHVADVVRWLGIKPHWWIHYDEVAPCTKQDLDDYMLSLFGGEVPLWLELLCCPVCLSFHLTWAVAILFLALGAPLDLAVACWSWPVVSLLIYGTLKTKL